MTNPTPPAEKIPEKSKYHYERSCALHYLNENDWACFEWSDKAIKAYVSGMLRERKSLAEERAIHEDRRVMMLNMAEKLVAEKEAHAALLREAVAKTWEEAASEIEEILAPSNDLGEIHLRDVTQEQADYCRALSKRIREGL